MGYVTSFVVHSIHAQAKNITSSEFVRGLSRSARLWLRRPLLALVYGAFSRVFLLISILERKGFKSLNASSPEKAI